MSLGENLSPVLHSNLIYILARVKALRKWRAVMETLTDLTVTLMEFLDSANKFCLKIYVGYSDLI